VLSQPAFLDLGLVGGREVMLQLAHRTVGVPLEPPLEATLVEALAVRTVHQARIFRAFAWVEGVVADSTLGGSGLLRILGCSACHRIQTRLQTRSS